MKDGHAGQHEEVGTGHGDVDVQVGDGAVAEVANVVLHTGQKADTSILDNGDVLTAGQADSWRVDRWIVG